MFLAKALLESLPPTSIVFVGLEGQERCFCCATLKLPHQILEDLAISEVLTELERRRCCSEILDFPCALSVGLPKSVVLREWRGQDHQFEIFVGVH